jgi:hypothetical protein
MAWVLSNVGGLIDPPLQRISDGSLFIFHIFRHCWLRSFCKLLSSFSCPSTRAYPERSTVNGNAKTRGANHTVNGYLIFILYSVALRTCA